MKKKTFNVFKKVYQKNKKKREKRTKPNHINSMVCMLYKWRQTMTTTTATTTTETKTETPLQNGVGSTVDKFEKLIQPRRKSLFFLAMSFDRQSRCRFNVSRHRHHKLFHIKMLQFVWVALYISNIQRQQQQKITSFRG